MDHTVHSLQHLLLRPWPYANLRIRGHLYQLPDCSSDLQDHIDVLYTYDCDCYFLCYIFRVFNSLFFTWCAFDTYP